MNIRLNFVNSAELAAATLPTILLFQKQHDSGDEVAVVWKVIEQCRHRHFHPFMFTDDASVSTGDAFGNFSRLMPARRGARFEITAAPGGRRQLQCEVNDLDPEHGGQLPRGRDTVSIVNRQSGSYHHACLFVRGELIAERRSLAHGDQADFSLEPILWVAAWRRTPDAELYGPWLPGRSRTVRAGDRVAHRAMASATAIELKGVASANIVMRGDAGQLRFEREAVVWA